MANVNWTQEAVRWLSEIHDFIAEDDADAAQRVVRGIYELAQTLRTFPNLGYQYVHSDRTVRILLYGHYRIAYMITESDDIDILGVFHGALDIDRYSL